MIISLLGRTKCENGLKTINSKKHKTSSFLCEYILTYFSKVSII